MELILWADVDVDCWCLYLPVPRSHQILVADYISNLCAKQPCHVNIEYSNLKVPPLIHAISHPLTRWSQISNVMHSSTRDLHKFYRRNAHHPQRRSTVIRHKKYVFVCNVGPVANDIRSVRVCGLNFLTNPRPSTEMESRQTSFRHECVSSIRH